MKEKKVGIMTLAITLISLGIMFLIRNFSNLDIFYLMSIVWPLIIIVFGIELIISKFIFERKETNVKMRIHFGSLFVILIIVVAMVSAFTINNILSPINISDYISDHGVSFFPGNYKYDSKFSKDMAIDCEGKEKLIVENSFGNVRVIGGDTDTIKADWEIIMKHNDEDYAKKVADEIIEIIQDEDDYIKVKSNIMDYNNKKDKINNIKINIKLKIPKDLKVDVSNKFGNVFIEDTSRVVKGDTNVKNTHNYIEVKNVGGNLNVESKYSEINIEGLQGNLKLKGNNGNMYLSHIDGIIDVINKYADIQIQDSNKDINVQNIHGNVIFESKELIKDKLDIENEYGDIRVTIPKNQKGDFKVYTKYGSIFSDFKFSINKEINEEVINKAIGEAKTIINLKTKNGDVEIDTN